MERGRLFGSGFLVLSAALLTMAIAPVSASASASALTASPKAVRPGEPVTFTGTDFAQCTTGTTTAVELYANGQPLVAASGASGGFQVTVPVGTTPGLYGVTARCSNVLTHDLASVSVPVVTLTLSPGSGLPGQTISVTGSGYTVCSEVQVDLVRDGTEAVATSGPVDAPGGTFDAQLTVPGSALPGDDYEVEDGCYAVSAVALPAAVLAAEPFTVTNPVASPSPTASSPSPSPSPSAASGSPSPSQSSTSRASSSPSPSVSATTPPPHIRSGGDSWTPVALVGGTGAGAVLITLGAVRASSLAHRRRGRAWVRKHMRAVAGQAGSVSAGVQERPGAPSISVGLEPHPDPLGHQQDEEAGQ